MRLGVHVIRFDVDGGPAALRPTLARVGVAADRAGVANLSVMDHYLQIMGDSGGPMLEGHTTLGFLAARRLHRRVAIGRAATPPAVRWAGAGSCAASPARCGLSQTQLAGKVGVTPAALSQFESGAARPSADTVGKFSAVLQIPEAFLGQPMTDTHEGSSAPCGAPR
jgi:DNA-binding XRE family transcriptional regulator